MAQLIAYSNSPHHTRTVAATESPVGSVLLLQPLVKFGRQQHVHFRPVAHIDLGLIQEVNVIAAIDPNGDSVGVSVSLEIVAVVRDHNELHPCPFEIDCSDWRCCSLSKLLICYKKID